MRPASCARLGSGVLGSGGGVLELPLNTREGRGILALEEDVPPGTRAGASYSMHHLSPSVAQEGTEAHPNPSPPPLPWYPKGLSIYK